MSVSHCKDCGKEIVWIRTPSGKSMPCDPLPTYYWQMTGGKERVVTPNGEIIACSLSGDLQKATGIAYIPHWSTCTGYTRASR